MEAVIEAPKAAQLTVLERKKRGPKVRSLLRKPSIPLMEISKMRPHEWMVLTNSQKREAVAAAEIANKSETLAYKKYVCQIARGKERPPFQPAEWPAVRPLTVKVERAMAHHSNGVLATRILDNRYWLAVRSEFEPIHDEQWDWYRTLSWKDMQILYETAIIERRIDDEIKGKPDHDKAMSQAAW